MFRSGLVDTLVTHANIKGFGLTPLPGACCVVLLPWLYASSDKNKTKSNYATLSEASVSSFFCNTTPLLLSFWKKEVRRFSFALVQVWALRSKIDNTILGIQPSDLLIHF